MENDHFEGLDETLFDEVNQEGAGGSTGGSETCR